MRVLVAHSAAPGFAVNPFHGKVGDNSTGGLFGDVFAQQASLLAGLSADLPVRTATPQENAPEGSSANGNSAGDKANNGNTASDIAAAASAKLEVLVAIPVVTTKSSSLINPPIGKDKKSAPARQSDETAGSNVTAASNVTVPASPLLNPLIQKSFFEWGLGWRDHNNESGTKEPEKTNVVHSASVEFAGHVPNDHAPNEATHPAPPSDPNTREVKPDAGLNVDGTTELPQSAQFQAQDPAKPQISRIGAGPSTQTTELAFASRIQEGASETQSKPNAAQQAPGLPSSESHPDQADPISPSAAPKAASVEDERKPAPVKTEAAQNPQAMAYAYGSRDDFKAQAAEAQPAHAITRVEMPPAPVEPAKTGAQLKDVTFQVTQSNEKVEVRIVQQAGEVRVAVRAGDTDLVHGLQQNLSDLSGKLQQSGYHADTWRPGATTEAASPGNDSRKGSGDSGNGQPQSQSGGSQQDRSQQNQNRFNRPRWVEEMESTLKTGKESTGVTYGFGT